MLSIFGELERSKPEDHVPDAKIASKVSEMKTTSEIAQELFNSKGEFNPSESNENMSLFERLPKLGPYKYEDCTYEG